jgi:predicted O-methyltransferase YrrM
MIGNPIADNATLQRILTTGTTTDAAGRVHRVDDAVSAAEAAVLAHLVRRLDARVTLETGTAFGVSALAICTALAALPATTPPRSHYGIDPVQTAQYGSAALAALERADLAGYFTLLEGPSHLELPALLAAGVQLDFAFIDGWHTFDYKLLDFFYIDKMLRPGGIVALHDYQWESTQKVVRFALTHRRYVFRAAHKKLLPRADTLLHLARVLKAVALRRGKKALLYNLRGLQGAPNMAILTKHEQYEPNYDFFESF